jgi:hypothetical protein
MKYKLKTGEVFCYAHPGLGNYFDQFLWFVKYGDPQYNFHKYNGPIREEFPCWRIGVVKSKVVLGLYK